MRSERKDAQEGLTNYRRPRPRPPNGRPRLRRRRTVDVYLDQVGGGRADLALASTTGPVTSWSSSASTERSALHLVTLGKCWPMKTPFPQSQSFRFSRSMLQSSCRLWRGTRRIQNSRLSP